MTSPRPVALISGGGSGIGLALAQALAPTFNLVLIGRSQARLERAAELLSTHSETQVIAVKADVTKHHALLQAVGNAALTMGRIDWVVAAAGWVRPSFFVDSRFEDHHAAITTHYLGSISLIQAALPYLKAQEQGRIILFSSACVFSPIVGYSAYAPSKSAVASFGKALALELEPNGIRVHVVYPPDTDTDLYREEAQIRPKVTDIMAQTTGLWTAEDVAQAIMKGIEKNKEMIIPAFLSRWDALLAPFLWPFLKLRQKRLIRRYGQRL